MFFAACANVVVPEATPLAMEYYHSGNVLWIVQQAWGLGLPLLFLMGGFSAKLAKCTERWGKKWFFGIALYLVFFIVLYSLANLPLNYYADYVRQHAYGLSTQTVAGWFNNYWKGIMVSLVTAVAFVWIFYLLLKKSPTRWWIYSTFVAIGVMFIVVFVQPIWIDPLFNDFGPMKDKQLEKQILDLASRAGISHGRVFEVNKSRDTKTLNAYVIGIGSSARIVLWDTALQRLKPDEILFVMGHEIGHYVMHHVWWDIFYMGVLSFIIFYLTDRSANFLMNRYPKQLGFTTLANIGSLPLLLFLVSLFLFLSTPVSNLVSRHMERAADMFGLEMTHRNEAAAKAFVVLQQENLGNPWPGPIYQMWRSTHPPLGERVMFCNTYCPWQAQKNRE